MNKRNWLGFSGLVYILVWVIGLLIPTGSPSVSASNAEIQQTLLAKVVLGAGIAAGSISLVQAGIQQTLANPELLVAADAPFRTLLVLVNQIDTFKLMALALLSASTSVLILRSQLIPAWIGWLGIALTAALLLGGLSFALSNFMFTYILFASLPMLLLWVGAVSVTMMKQTK